jgi:DNA-directed RNA polymerase subunit RPC12/RpoP
MATQSDTATVKPGDQVWESRAVARLIEAGCAADCPYCGERVKFRARHRDQQVICNVYENGVWQRVEQYHADCYVEAGMPYGEPS